MPVASQHSSPISTREQAPLSATRAPRDRYAHAWRRHHKPLLLLTEGKPNDCDLYEGS